ncbi:MAG: hypothetical protein JJ975_16130, partial [Bacteroidia bacterium]|nr:hypothetical protein [Bacteroidia bacterium]
MELNNQKEELSITDTLKQVGRYWSEIWQKRWYVVMGSALLAALLVTQAWLTPKRYNAPLTFMINENDGGGLSGVAAVLGELGFGDAGSGGHNYEKITQLATSRMILGRAFKTECEVNGVKDYLGNHILNVYRDDIPGGPITPPDFRFQDSGTTEYRSNEERIILQLSKLMNGNPTAGEEGILKLEYDDESTVIWINAKTLKPDLSIAISNTAYDVLSEFYVSNSIEKQQNTYDHVSNKADSIFGQLRAAENQLAQYKDQSVGIFLNKNRLPSDQLNRKVKMLYTLYAEAIKNQETA